YQFEAIHPFMDGNGRIGRLLISLTLCLDDILPLPLLYLSAYFHRNREEYYSRLLQVSAQGAWMKWVLYFARGVAIEANDAADRVQRLKDLHGDYTRRVQTARASALLTALIDELFNRPVVTVAIVTKLLKVTPPTAHRHVDRLIELGILRLASPQRKRNRIYVADEILQTAYDAELKEV
ncbi:MAG: Fic family protein, partial [Phycisphaerae bacterium]|nr:Fic family protein [Phycisphaerae bacterium]